MKSIWISAALALTAVACGGAAVDDASNGESEMVAAPDQALSDDGVGAATGLLDLTRLLLVAPGEPAVDALKTFAQESLTDVRVAERPGGGRRFLFSGIVLQGGDIVTGSIHLEVDEVPSGFEAPPSYTARLVAGSAAEGARALPRNEVRFAQALLKIANELAVSPESPNSVELRKFASLSVGVSSATFRAGLGGGARYTVDAVILEGGDIAVGDARLVVDEETVTTGFEFGPHARYTVKAHVERQTNGGGPGCQRGGCSGELCVPAGDPSFSICLWQPEYACYQSAVCERQADGACGFTPTAELNACLASVK